SYKNNPDTWGRTGSKATKETKKKMSRSLLGKKRTEEQKRNISIGTKKAFDKIGFEPWNKGLTKETNEMLKTVSEKNMGNECSEETKDKLRQINIGKKHSDVTKRKLSEMFSGNKNPSKRRDVRKTLRENHISRTDPDRWKEMVKKIGDSQRGREFTEEHREAIAEGKMKSSK
ncbi:unnamed protein product, partial [marine sediment metagenome]